MTELIAATQRGDATAVQQLLRAPLAFGGIWFEDVQCRTAFAGAGTIEQDRLPAFARCLAGLRLARSERSNPFANIGVVTYPPGIELEVLFVRDGRPRVQWIGYVSRRELDDALPTITQRSLEARRIAPAPLVLDPAVAARIATELENHRYSKQAFAWFKLCIDAKGSITGVHPRMTSSLVAHAALLEAVKQWRFEPFVLGDQPSPVCSLVRVDHPSPPPEPGLEFPFPVTEGAASAVVVPTDVMERRRIAGSKLVVPDDDAKRAIAAKGLARIRGVFQYCVDEQGKTTRPFVARSTGFPTYDARILASITRWRFTPVIIEGQARLSCTHVTFIYHQR